MHLKQIFEVDRDRDGVVELLCRDESLLQLLGEGTEITESEGDRRTTRTPYDAMGREGVATFDFEFLMDGNVRFEKRCDGIVWSKLQGEISVEELNEGSRVEIELSGATKALVPEFTVKGPMEDQLVEMVAALEGILKVGAD